MPRRVEDIAREAFEQAAALASEHEGSRYVPWSKAAPVIERLKPLGLTIRDVRRQGASHEKACRWLNGDPPVRVSLKVLYGVAEIFSPEEWASHGDYIRWKRLYQELIPKSERPKLAEIADQLSGQYGLPFKRILGQLRRGECSVHPVNRNVVEYFRKALLRHYSAKQLDDMLEQNSVIPKTRVATLRYVARQVYRGRTVDDIAEMMSATSGRSKKTLSSYLNRNPLHDSKNTDVLFRHLLAVGGEDRKIAEAALSYDSGALHSPGQVVYIPGIERFGVVNRVADAENDSFSDTILRHVYVDAYPTLGRSVVLAEQVRRS